MDILSTTYLGKKLPSILSLKLNSKYMNIKKKGYY
jgi:hypothetical protein